MRRAFSLSALWALLGGSVALAQTTSADIGPATGGGRPSNGGGAVPPTTRPAGWYGTYLGKPPPANWLGVVKGRALPGSGVDRTMADFGGIAPNDLGPATRPDAGIGNPSISAVRPDVGIGNSSAARSRPDEQIGISWIPLQPSEVHFTSRPVQRMRPYTGIALRNTIFPGGTKLRGEVNPGWARSNGNVAAPSTAAPALAKGTGYLPGSLPAQSTGGYTAQPPSKVGQRVPGASGQTRPVPRTGIVGPPSSGLSTRPVPRATTAPGAGAGKTPNGGATERVPGG